MSRDRTRTFTVSSELPVPPDAVWARVATLDGVNHELGPWFRMTSPRGATLTPEAVPLGERYFRSWILLFGVLPVDYDDLTILSIEPGRGFHERSSMLSQRLWEHLRTLEALDGGVRTRGTDQITFAPRLAVASGAQGALFAAVFRHRHRRLARAFAG
jgi:hypothetical protein